MSEAARAQNRYRVLERLESGGMAEVFRGESESVAGFKKLVAIKRVLPHLASNDKFIRMFLDEARLSARLSHANIVQVFDIGHVENTYFIVMEYVDGVNLKAVMEHCRKHGPLPVPFACLVAMRMCEGLFYAHEATDSDGRALGIVHRDVSPPNVLLSKRGEIKLVDFGLAKAAHSVEKTEPGIVKGKFSYLAPETARGQDADLQADIYACGIILWEMLANRRLFTADTDFQTVKLVQQGVVPPIRSIRPEVPEDLAQTLDRALARDKSERYPTAQAFGEDVTTFLFSHGLKVTAFDISALVKQIAAERVTRDGKEGRREHSVIDQLIQEEMLRFTSLGSAESRPLGSPQPVSPDTLSEGAVPLAAQDFVNPSDWARELGDVPVGSGTMSRGAGWDEPGDAMRQTPPGNLADALEAEGPVEPDPPLPVIPARRLTPGIPLVRSRAFRELAAPPAAVPRKFPGKLVAVLAGAVAIVVGLYFAGVIHLPH